MKQVRGGNLSICTTLYARITIGTNVHVLRFVRKYIATWAVAQPRGWRVQEQVHCIHLNKKILGDTKYCLYQPPPSHRKKFKTSSGSCYRSALRNFQIRRFARFLFFADLLIHLFSGLLTRSFIVKGNPEDVAVPEGYQV